jgi:hypothetical protein
MSKIDAYSDGYIAGRNNARAELLAALKKTAEYQIRQAARIESKIADNCEQGSLMGYNYDGRIRGIEDTLGAFESSLNRQGLDLELEW